MHCIHMSQLQAGRPVIPGSDRCTRWVVMATQSSVMVMNTISTLMGGHTLASPKGGGPCSLGTFNYRVASHLAFRLTKTL